MGKVGDPTGEDDGRILLDDAALQRNTDGISKVFQPFLFFDKEEEDALGPQQQLPLVPPVSQYLNFLRDYGRHFTINFMLPSSSASPARPHSASSSSTA